MQKCGVATYTVADLFDCTNDPFCLTVHDVWDEPADAADFIYFINCEV